MDLTFDVVVVGAGYAGVMAALRLAGKGRKRGVRVALVNPNHMFVERLRLHETLVTAPKHPLRSVDLRALCKRVGIVFFHGRAIGMDRGTRQIRVESAEAGAQDLSYRRLILAVGSISAVPDLPGDAEICYTMTPEGDRGAGALQRALATQSAPNVTVIGGGTTGIELAAELTAKPDAKVSIVTAGALGRGLHPAVLARVRKVLDRKGVRVVENAPVNRVCADSLDIETGTLRHDLVVAATGFRMPPQWPGLNLRPTADHRIPTDPFLRSLEDPRIFVAGDAAIVDAKHSAPPRMSVFYALSTGAHAADVILDEFAGRVPRRFGFWTYGQAVGLGDEAIGYGTMRFDQAYRPFFTGKTGAAMRQFFISVLFKLMMLEARHPGLPFYMGRPLRRAKSQWQKAGVVGAD